MLVFCAASLRDLVRNEGQSVIPRCNSFTSPIIPVSVITALFRAEDRHLVRLHRQKIVDAIF